jgi:DNA-binding transcriptional MocR family regulator
MAQTRFSSRLNDLHASPIREILSVVNRPGMISFAGGLPCPDTFPVLDVKVPQAALQYGATEGDLALRQRISEDLLRLGLDCNAEQVLVLSGSQQGIDLVAKLFIDRETPVAVESPTYLAALQAFRFFGARFLSFTPGQCAKQRPFQQRPAFVYVIPTFQNPTGHCYSVAQREALAFACDQNDVPVFEDDPYRDLAYTVCDRTPICAQLKKALWIYQGSFSKTLAPGLRLGFLAASRTLVPYLTRLKQAADLHSSRLSQWLVLNQLAHPDRAARRAALVETYRAKRDTFARRLEGHFPGLADWDIPPGGLFFWLRLRSPLDTQKLLQSALAQGVAFMPGEPFYPDLERCNGTLRLNFSHANEAEMDRGLGILAELVREARPTPRDRKA